MSRKPSRQAIYAGDCRDAVGQIVGPNTLGEYMQCVDAEFDADRDRTRLGFAFNVRRNADGSLSLLEKFPVT